MRDEGRRRTCGIREEGRRNAEGRGFEWIGRWEEEDMRGKLCIGEAREDESGGDARKGCEKEESRRQEMGGRRGNMGE